MVKISSSMKTTGTLAAEKLNESGIINQTDIETEMAHGKKRDRTWYSTSTEAQIAEVETDKVETEQTTEYVREVTQDEEAEKNRRARANALMDAQCLHYLEMFKKEKVLYVEDLNERLKQPKDWLKIAILMRADYLQALESTIRITHEGLTAWENLNKLSDLSDALNEPKK